MTVRSRRPKGFKEAYDAYCQGGGWVFAVPAEFGGQGLPYTLHSAVGEYMSSANMALMMYPGLTQGAIAAILEHGSDEQKQKYLPKMVEVSGRHHEPHRAPLRHRPRPAAHQGGSERRRFLQDFRPEDLHLGGEHDMSDNIIHLVLARIEGAPEGTKGISLFIVPKFMVGDDGSVGARNGVTCGAIEHKMAFTATPPAS